MDEEQGRVMSYKEDNKLGTQRRRERGQRESEKRELNEKVIKSENSQKNTLLFILSSE